MKNWAPPLERSRLATLAFCGCYAGLMFGMPIAGELLKRLGPFSPFYFYGVVGIIWYSSWLWLVFEKPRYHTCIEAKELYHIESSLGEQGHPQVIPTISNAPWKAFFTSMPCYAIFVANFCRSWNFYLLVLFQTQYFREIYDIDVEKVTKNENHQQTFKTDFLEHLSWCTSTFPDDDCGGVWRHPCRLLA